MYFVSNWFDPGLIYPYIKSVTLGLVINSFRVQVFNVINSTTLKKKGEFHILI